MARRVGSVHAVPNVILPVLNEAQALPWVLERMPAGFEPIVVDNGSTDGSGALAERLGARVIAEPRRGFGAACLAGLLAARAEVVCFMDCDASFDPCDLPRVTGLLLDDRADLVLSSRRARPGVWPLHARLGNRLVASELRRRMGIRVTDLGPMRAARREDLLALGIRDRRSGWPLEMVVLAARRGWRILEVPVDYHPRAGRSKVTGTLRGTVQAASDMAKVLRA